MMVGSITPEHRMIFNTEHDNPGCQIVRGP